MTNSSVRHIPCGVAVNASELLAVEKLKSKLQTIPGPWVVLSNLTHSSSANRLSDEIDLVAIGPVGVVVVEVKHWDAAFLKQRPDVSESEAERINEKAKRIAAKLRSTLEVGFISPRLLLTRGGTGLQGGQRIHVRGVPVFGLSECKELVSFERGGNLNGEMVERAAQLLAPTSRVALGGELRHFAGLINLERQSPIEDSFHRVYRGQHSTRRDKVVLHVYDLSAADDKEAETRAPRVRCHPAQAEVSVLAESA